MVSDWKFYVTLVAAIVGILIPIWLWQADLSAHSLSVRLASSVALQPTETVSIPDVQISIDGVNIKSPFLSTLELSNDGSKPVLASDFESHIELSVSHNTQIVRARVTSVEPNNLKAELDTNKQSVKLRPMLLNPNDKLTIAIITSESPPHFSAQARIAGVSKIKFEDTTTKEKNWKRFVINIIIAFVGFVLYWVYAAFLIRPTTVRLGRALSMITMFTCGTSSSLAIHQSFEAAGMDFGKFFNFWAAAVACFVFGISIVLYTWRRANR